MLASSFLDQYTRLYELTENTSLSDREEALVGFAAAIALDCLPCAQYYKHRCENCNVSQEDMGNVAAKVMVVSAGKKKFTVNELLKTG